MPDIDIDFCMRRRGEVIEYVTQKYGRENVAQIITFGTMAAKAAVKDVGRAMDIPYGEVDRLAKLIPTTLGIELDDALKQAPQLKCRGGDADERLKDLMAVALRLEGLARHASTHAAGVVISPRPLTDIVPVYKTNRDEITTQYDMNALERIGLLKMDFLGLTTLTVLHDTVEMIEQQPRRKGRSRQSRRWMTRTLINFSRAATPPRFSSLNRTACATSCGAISRRASKTLPR